MYKLLLCCRYLRTRYIALASIISVMLGVATMIVVNSVMSGFTTEMQNRIHGILSDVTFASRSVGGMRDAEFHMAQIRRVAGDSIAGMTPTVVVPGMLNYQYDGEWITRQVQIIGIDEETQSQVSSFGRYLQHPANRKQMSFELREGGYDTRDHQAGDEAPERWQMAGAGWKRRRMMAQQRRLRSPAVPPQGPPAQTPLRPLPGSGVDSEPIFGTPPVPPGPSGEPDQSDQAATGWPAEASPWLAGRWDRLRPAGANLLPSQSGLRLPRRIEPLGSRIRFCGTESPVGESPVGEPPAPLPEDLTDAASGQDAASSGPLVNPFAGKIEADQFDPATQTHEGTVLGILTASFRNRRGEDRFLVVPGDDVKLTLPTAAMPPKIVSDNFTVSDVYESKMSEYDSSFVFVRIRKLQQLRGMIDPTTGVGLVNSIQIKLKEGVDGAAVRDKLRAAFPEELYVVDTWRDKQGPLLAAVEMETAILNVLLFLIIAVAGFGILAIFLMIVVEKTRDIGILKSLGASGKGVMGIFLSYGLSLGMVGSGVGTVLGLLFVEYINEIAGLLGRITGRPVFDPSIYYFYKIPTIVSPTTVGCIVAGAITIAVLASVLPALRAAMLHPVEALRYE